MAQTATGLLPLLREAWTAEEAVKQFEAGNGPLARIRKVKSTMIGKQAQVPIHKGRNLGGYTSVGAAGGNLNTAGNQQVDQATYTLVYHWLSVALDASALMQAGGSNQQSIVEGKVLEIENGIENIKHQSVRQLMTNGDSIVAACASGGASTTISLVASPSGTAWGYDAIVRGWLGVGSVIDVGTTADTDALLTAGTVTGVSESASAPTITTATSITTVAGTHFVYIANPNSATAANPEINGLRNLINTSGAVGGLNPSTAGQEFWQAASRDTATTVFSLDLALSLQRGVMQKSGQPQTDVWTGLKQQANFYSLLQNQVRFTGDTTASAGSVSTTKWNGMTVDAFPDVLDSDWYCLTLSDFCRISGAADGPVWASSLEGNGGGQTRWAQDTTQFKDALCYPLQIGLNRRNTQAAATGLTT
jgi:hypothetical protein